MKLTYYLSCNFQVIFDEFESEADVLLNSLDIYENTALHIAAREGHQCVALKEGGVVVGRVGVRELLICYSRDCEIRSLNLPRS